MYNVVILAEQAMTAGDAHEVVSLHDAIEEARHYHVIIPGDDAQQRVETALQTLGSDSASRPAAVAAATHDVPAAGQRAANDGAVDPVEPVDPVDPVAASVTAIRSLGVEASGEYSAADPIDDLDRVVARQRAAEVIVMTRPHVVAELLHLDWASKARRRIGVPVLHLLEHEPLDVEAGNGQGITGM